MKIAQKDVHSNAIHHEMVIPQKKTMLVVRQGNQGHAQSIAIGDIPLVMP
jgi:hypothetical protein